MDGELRFHPARAQHRPRDNGDPGSGRAARHNGVVRAVFHHAIGRHLGTSEPRFQAAAIGATRSESEQRALGEIGSGLDAGVIARGDQDEFLGEHVHRLQAASRERFDHERCLQVFVQHFVDQRCAGSRDQFDAHRRILAVVAR